MKTEAKKLPRGQVELIIELSVEEYQPFLQEATKTISQSVKIAGFRPGKAPYEIIKQKVGENEIWQQALEPAVRKTFLKAIEEQKLITVGSPKIDVVKLAPNNPVVYQATISLLPKVTLGDYSKIKIREKPVAITEEQIKKTLGDLQKMHAKEVLVNRKAQKGDKVEIDFETFLDKIPIDNGKQQNFPIVIGEGTFIPGFEDQLIDLAEGQTKEFPLKFPENYHQKNLAGKLVDFKIKIQAVYELQLPKLDEEFSKSLGNFETIKKLEEKIEENLKIEQQDKEKRRLEDEILDKIITQSTLEEIPDLLIDSEAKKMIEELEQSLNSQGLKFEDYLTHLKKGREDLLLDFIEPAIRRVKSALIIREIAKKINIEATDLEVDQEIEKTLQLYKSNPDVEKQLKHPDYKNYLKNILISRKTIDHLKSVMVE